LKFEKLKNDDQTKAIYSFKLFFTVYIAFLENEDK